MKAGRETEGGRENSSSDLCRATVSFLFPRYTIPFISSSMLLAGVLVFHFLSHANCPSSACFWSGATSYRTVVRTRSRATHVTTAAPLFLTLPRQKLGGARHFLLDCYSAAVAAMGELGLKGPVWRSRVAKCHESAAGAGGTLTKPESSGRSIFPAIRQTL